ncbi:MAG: NAD(P)/FAD-dependent oxidoreductase [Bacteroidetes bacterium]|jgi:predicted Rossmann fold flavoprotein|nr:NAD(P)/FAD-dependent oxidoreductase [Bacteroidota bacterium]MBT4411761.1 NAD(P)/FAD-dependent oxidoreductase [Bacteroidota bacterium]MBT5426692.1 NAD(P)/FAD-dependent oxidoreductase [Bacteroidota bacterium]MBT7463381.1 NAD(P)/FAD-dependent oxidoreductase [Bacteroidota bacterium]
MENYDAVIIGSGASGLLAAGYMAEAGLQVIVLEKMSQSGRKLSITGKGRCNITNDTETQDFIERVNPDGRFLLSSFSQFYNQELIDLFERIGIKTKLERGGRYFPANDSAPDVVKKMIEWCDRKGVIFKHDFRVNRIITTRKFIEGGSITSIKAVQGTSIAGQRIKHKREVIVGESSSFSASFVLLCTGGLSYPATGSDGDGHRMLKQLGHSVSKCLPSLVPLEIDSRIVSSLTGLELRNVQASLQERGKTVSSEFGELHFIKTGLSGPIILTLSRIAVSLLHQQKSLSILIDFKPGLDGEKLNRRLIRDFTDRAKEPVSSILRGLMPKKLVSVCVASTGIHPNKPGSEVSAKDRKEIHTFLKAFSLKLTGYRPFSEAIITNGGLDVKEINQKTLESKKVAGLYIAGEILDLDGPTGGFNLQIAFSTAKAAAQAIISKRSGVQGP